MSKATLNKVEHLIKASDLNSSKLNINTSNVLLKLYIENSIESYLSPRFQDNLFYINTKEGDKP